MNVPRILACLAAAGLLAGSLSAQGRTDRHTVTMDRSPSPAFVSMSEGSNRVGHGGEMISRDRNTSLGHESRTITASGMGRTVPHGVAVVNSRTHFPFGPGRMGYFWRPCLFQPDALFWGQRDILAEIQFMSREGFVPCTLVADDALDISDYTFVPEGWKGYAFVVPPQGTLHISLNHLNRPWFRLIMMNKWGDLEQGMLQNVMVHPRDPEVSYTNPSNENRAVYVIADDPGWMSSKAYPYQLSIERSWQPGTVDPKSVKVAAGVWGYHQDMSAQFRRPTWVGFGSWGQMGGGWW